MSGRRWIALCTYALVVASPGRAEADNLQADNCLPVPESCDGIDNDCDGIVDEGDSATFELYQGGTKIATIEPLATASSIGHFYAYGAPVPASYSGTQPSAQSDTSLIFLHINALSLRRSLVVVHDAANDGSGGEAQFSFYNLGNGAELLVADDPVEISVDDFGQAHDAHMHWQWLDCCTDGVAIGELTFTDGCITVDANFIDGIGSWQFLAGNPGQPDAFALDKNQPLQICPEVCNDCPSASLASVPSQECVAGLALVGLDASASFDPSGEDLSYQWFIDGEPIFGAGETNQLFLAPGSYTAQVVVSDGLCSTTELVSFTIGGADDLELVCPSDLAVSLDPHSCKVTGSSIASLTDPCSGEVQTQTQFFFADEAGEFALDYLLFDDAGAAHQCEQSIVITGPTQPEIVMESPVNILWSPSHECIDLSLEESCGVSATIPCTDPSSVVPQLNIVKITSDESHDVGKGGDGHTADDIEITGATTFRLRPERQGAGDGRIYTVHFEAIGPGGDVTLDSCQFIVPHDISRSPNAGDDGVAAECYPDDGCLCLGMPDAGHRAKNRMMR